MKDTYRGNMRTSAPSMINTKGFIGPNKGWLTNGLGTAHGIYKIYKGFEPFLKGDETEATAEETEEAYPYHDYDANGNSYSDEGGDGRMESEREAYEAGKKAQQEIAEEDAKLKAEADERVANGYDPTPVDDDYDDWYESTKITTVTPEEGYKAMEFEDSSAKEWQKFLVDNKYLAPTYKGKDGKQHNSVDGDWGPESQKAYEAYMKDHPKEE